MNDSIVNKKPTTSDQRYFPRWQVKNRALYQLEDQTDTFETQTLDLSCSGACLNISPSPVLTDQKLKLMIYLTPNKFVNVSGKIVWTKNLNNQLEAGIRFENVQPKTQEIILQYAFEVRHDQVTKHWFDGWTNK